MIASWLDTREQTTCRWFDRLEAEPIDRAIPDRQCSGRPPKLDDYDRKEFREVARNPSTEADYDRPAWATELAKRFLTDEFDIEYSRRHVQ